MTELNVDEAGARGIGVGAGLGVVLHGSRPSSYTELARGLSFTKLPPKPFGELAMYRWPGRGALNMLARETEPLVRFSSGPL